ncbi:TDT family transporter [Gordonia sp. DT219]|uniref:SLAC1 family transporter n=1 Tax=Gordonia sp. DT219 TaxID=3416658 RepID=UPI003CEF65F4
MTLLGVPARSWTLRPDRFAHVPPNWFASVMGTGIVAVAAHAIDDRSAVLTGLSVAFWLLTCIVFAGVVTATAAHWYRHPDVAREHHRHPVTAHFYGAVPMAILTVGTSTLVAGSHVIGHGAALAVDAVCFTVGTIGAVVTAVLVPARHLVGRAGDRGEPFGGWLMSVVGPTVTASAAAVLAASVDSAATSRILLLVGALALAISLILASPILVAVVRRLVTTGPGPDGLAPTWWIVLGPLGQSVTAACLLPHTAAAVLDAPTARVVRDVGLAYAIPVWVAAACWIVVAATITARSIARGLPFGLTWWSFTFPLGTFVTGSAALATVLGGTVFGVMLFTVTADAGFVALLCAWTIVTARAVAETASPAAQPLARGTLER